MSKKIRILAIERIIRTETITSQYDLLKKLEDEGISCTQATLSRNLRQLGVSKVINQKGKTVYQFQEGEDTFKDDNFSDLSRAINQTISASNMILIKSYPGYAAAIAAAIDKKATIEIAGTIAGDDTVLVIPHNGYSPESVKTIINQIFS